MTILPNAIYRFNVICIILLMALLTELEQKSSQFIWKLKRPQIAKAVLRKNEAGGINLPEYRLYYEATVIKTVWHCLEKKYRPMKERQKYRPMEEDRDPRDKPMHLWIPYF